MKKRYFDIIKSPGYDKWKKQFKISVGMYPVGGLFVEKGGSEMIFSGTEDELLSLFEESVKNFKDLLSAKLKPAKHDFFNGQII